MTLKYAMLTLFYAVRARFWCGYCRGVRRRPTPGGLYCQHCLTAQDYAMTFDPSFW